MSFHRPTLLELAMHEAGHAYAFAALVHHEEPFELGLALDEAGQAHGWCRRLTLLHPEITLARIPADVRPGTDWQAAAEIVIAVSGPVAEFRHRLRGRFPAAWLALENAERFLRPEAFDTDGDFQRIRDTLDYIEAPDPLGSLKRQIDVSDMILAANWPAIRRLGRELLERRRLGERRLAEWFLRNPPKRWMEPLPLQ